jgi:Lrp/AsnC family leucine-responsive transcriptional regulator
MDNIDLRILDILQTDGRVTMKELGQRVGLTSPATIERVKKLEESGIIGGYRAVIDVVRAGLPVRAFLFVSLAGQTADAFLDLVRGHEGLIACHRLAGGASYLLEAAVADTAALESLLDQLAPFGKVETSIVLSTPVADKKLTLP